MMDQDMGDEQFEASVVAMLHRRAADIDDPSELPLIDTHDATVTAIGERRARGVAVLAVAAVAALVIGLGVWVLGSEDTSVSVVDEAPTQVPDVDPEPDEQESSAVAVSGPGVVFTADGEVLFEFGPDGQPATEGSLAASNDYRIAMMRGLLDADGGSAGDAQFSAALATDPALAEAVAESAAGLRIYTTFDNAAQDMARDAIVETLPQDERGFTMAMVSIDPSSGAIRALIGGPGRETVPVNIALSPAGRQPGSAFGAAVVAAALDEGYLPTDNFDGRGPCQIESSDVLNGIYEVNNFGDSPGAVLPMSMLTTSSSNCGMIAIGHVVGPAWVVRTAQELGLDSMDLRSASASVPLGTQAVSPLEMAVMQATLTNGGERNDAFVIERIENEAGEVLYRREATPRVVLSAAAACRTIEILETNVRAGTGSNAALVDQPAAGIAGTTDGFGDAWFVGSTPHLATALWMGHPEGNIVKMTDVGGLATVTGGSFPARAWGAFNDRFHDRLERRDFAECEPPSREGRSITSPFIGAITAEDHPDIACPGAEGCGGRPDRPPIGQSQTLDSGQTLECPSTHPDGYDTDADGIIDMCFQSELSD